MPEQTRWTRLSRSLAEVLRDEGPLAAWEAIEGELDGPDAGQDDDDLAFLFHAVLLAAQYGEEDRARAWIARDRTRREAARPPGTGDAAARDFAAHQVINLALSIQLKEYGAAEEALPAIDWEHAPATGWVWVTRLFVAARLNRRAELIDLLRRPSPLAPLRPERLEPYDRASLLRILGRFFFLGERGSSRSRGFYQAAMRAYAMEPGVHARLKEVEILGWWGEAAHLDGDLDLAGEYFSRAIEQASELRHRNYEESFRTSLLLVYSDREEHAAAENLAKSLLAGFVERPAGAAAELFRHAHALEAAAGAAMDRGDLDGARGLLDEAERLLLRRDHTRYRGHLHLLRGRLLVLERPDAGREEALSEFDAAEACFRGWGDGDLWGLATLGLYRAHAFLKIHKGARALDQAERADKVIQARGLRRLEADCVLLKSEILLEKGLERAEALYEDILGNLGRVKPPVKLFKVVSNLYIYSWDLKDHVDLTAYHLRQVHRMADVLDPTTFRNLYHEHVALRVMRRAMARTFGLDPKGLDGGDGGGVGRASRVDRGLGGRVFRTRWPLGRRHLPPNCPQENWHCFLARPDSCYP